jgi:hypothetical protein
MTPLIELRAVLLRIATVRSAGAIKDIVENASMKGDAKAALKMLDAIIRQHATEEKILAAMNAEPLEVPQDEEGYFAWLKLPQLSLDSGVNASDLTREGITASRDRLLAEGFQPGSRAIRVHVQLLAAMAAHEVNTNGASASIADLTAECERLREAFRRFISQAMTFRKINTEEWVEWFETEAIAEAKQAIGEGKAP